MFRRANFAPRNFGQRRARSRPSTRLLMAGPSEVLLAASAELPAQLERIPARTRVEDWVWTRDFAVPLVERQLNVRSLEGFGLDGHEPAAIAAGAVLHYVRTTQKNRSAAHRQPEVRRALDGARTRPGDGAQPRTGRAAFLGPGRSRHAVSHARCMPDADGQAPAARNDSAAAQSMQRRLKRATRPLPKRTRDLLKREEIRRAFSGILDLERLLARISLDSAGRAMCARWRRAWRGCRPEDSRSRRCRRRGGAPSLRISTRSTT